MVIKLENNNVSIKGKDVSVLIVTTGSTARKFADDIILSGKRVEVSESSFLVANPGEYEIKDVFVYALDTNESDEANIFSVLLEDVQVVYLNADTSEIDKSIVGQIGEDHILIMDFADDKNLDKRLKLVSDFDPAVFIPVTQDDTLAKKIANELGTDLPERESKLKYSDTDFTDDEQSMAIALLSK